MNTLLTAGRTLFSEKYASLLRKSAVWHCCRACTQPWAASSSNGHPYKQSVVSVWGMQPQDEGWKRLAACLNFGISNRPKRIQTSHRLFIQGFLSWKYLYNSLLRRQSSSLSPRLRPRLPIIWQTLREAIPHDKGRFWQQNQWQRFWGLSPAELGRVGQPA